MKRADVVSSCILSIGFQVTVQVGDNAYGVLEVEFKTGTVYRYDAVPQSIHVEIMRAPSVKKALYALVETKGYAYTQMKAA